MNTLLKTSASCRAASNIAGGGAATAGRGVRTISLRQNETRGMRRGWRMRRWRLPSAWRAAAWHAARAQIVELLRAGAAGAIQAGVLRYL